MRVKERQVVEQHVLSFWALAALTALEHPTLELKYLNFRRWMRSLDQLERLSVLM